MQVCIAVILALTLLPHSTLAQNSQTRAEEVKQRRDKEGGVHGDDELTKVEQGVLWAERNKVIERVTRGYNGLRIVLGNLIPSSGFALGPEYYRDDISDGAVQFRVGARASIQQFVLGEAQLSFPKLLSRRANVDLYTRWRNYPAVAYYGPGPESDKNSRTSYRLEDASQSVVFGIRPFRGMNIGTTVGHLAVNVGPAGNDKHPSTERIYSPTRVPGLDHQTDFLMSGVAANYDWRDNPGGAKYGGFYEARLDVFSDRDLKQYSFRRLTLEAQQYIPFLNRRRIIALRAKSLLAYTSSGQTVPFYMHSLLGGQNDLRGFPFARFYDENALVMNGEYRWEIFSGLDAALFFDAGKVFPKKSQLNFHDLETSAGFGFRVNTRNVTFLRMDFGFSHEGWRIWFTFNDIFGNSGGVAQSLYTTRVLIR